MIPPIHREPEPDVRIGAVLRSIAAAATAAAATAAEATAGSAIERDADALAARIVQAARPRLAQLRTAPRPWWEWTASWARIAIPAGLAASLAAGALVMAEGGASLAAAEPAAITESALVLGASDSYGTELASGLLLEPTDEWLLGAVLDR